MRSLLAIPLIAMWVSVIGPPARADSPKPGADTTGPIVAQDEASGPAYHDMTEIIRSLAPIEYLPEHSGAGHGPPRRPPSPVNAQEQPERRMTGVEKAPIPPSVDLDVRFAYDSAELLPEARAQLNALGRALTSPALAHGRFLIGGHTDAAGSDDYNLALSQRRADAVRAWLIARHGMAPERLVAEGFGESVLKDPNLPRAAVNRRVEVRRLDPPPAPSAHWPEQTAPNERRQNTIEW